ncbi:STAS domain-containing protein [Paenibacillus sp. MMS20-IR301]|uniref:STAS domain-containing protein n=1 Tax=Paenibacillus sp. MMS20-IR301 TaxID=2895946 RepID=UPI0028E33F34|nr:STAS domain-containing protein [Paenibacillus sp. MMS20-IR301]WNS44611.1 STAS domain-containing protein [Paenibacillus sp. MMS20-IR301]
MSSLSEIVIEMPELFSVEEAGSFRETLRKYIQDGDSSFLLDFGGCQFIDSTGLGVIVSSYKKCVETGGTIRLTRMNGNVRKIFELTRLTHVFEIV